MPSKLATPADDGIQMMGYSRTYLPIWLSYRMVTLFCELDGFHLGSSDVHPNFAAVIRLLCVFQLLFQLDSFYAYNS